MGILRLKSLASDNIFLRRLESRPSTVIPTSRSLNKNLGDKTLAPKKLCPYVYKSRLNQTFLRHNYCANI